jgi:hypothetical protein
VMVLGSTGSGKTVAVANAILGEVLSDYRNLPPEERTSVVITDPKSDLVKAVLQGMCAHAPELLGMVEYLDPFSAGGFPFNLNHLSNEKVGLDIRAIQLASLVSTVSTGTGGQKHLTAGARQTELLRGLLRACLDSPHEKANVLWALDALTYPRTTGLKSLAAATSSMETAALLRSLHISDELRASTASRLRTAFGLTENLARLVTSDSCVQFPQLTAPGKVTLICLGEPPLASLGEFWASLMVRLLLEYLLSRPSPWSHHSTRMVLDEAQMTVPAISDLAERILTTGRSKGLSLVVMTQGTSLIKNESESLLRVLVSNTANKMVGRLSASDAEIFAKEQTTSPGLDERLSETRTKFVSEVTNLPDRMFFWTAPNSRVRFRSVDVDLAYWKAAADVQEEELESVKKKHALPPAKGSRSFLPLATRTTSKARESRGKSIGKTKGGGNGKSWNGGTKWG